MDFLVIQDREFLDILDFQELVDIAGQEFLVFLDTAVQEFLVFQGTQDQE